MDEHGNFIVIGAINRPASNGKVDTKWGSAIVANDSEVPAFGKTAPYDIIEEFTIDLPQHLAERVLHTLPLPLPCSNYPMLFAPEQYPDANSEVRPSYPFHMTPIPDFDQSHGRQLLEPITLKDWVTAKGELDVLTSKNGHDASFKFEFSGLIPNSLYTIMSLRQRDLDPSHPTRPGPLGIPNVFITDEQGNAAYRATMPNPFPDETTPGANRIVNVVVLWMSYQLSHGGAIGRYGLGGDIHAQLKLRSPSFQEFMTKD
ncbi:MAG: hypothetical protein ABJO27_18235 [Pseudoruegeria sp.]